MFAASVEAYEKKLKAESLQQGIEQGIEQGLKNGRQQGIEQGKLQVARRLLGRGFSASETAELAGLSEQEVRNLTELRNLPER